MNQVFTGTVISLKNAKTAAIELVFNYLHPKYHKPIRRKKKIQAHYEKYDLKLGDKVVIKSSRPYSAIKRFLVIEKANKKNQTIKASLSNKKLMLTGKPSTIPKGKLSDGKPAKLPRSNKLSLQWEDVNPAKEWLKSAAPPEIEDILLTNNNFCEQNLSSFTRFPRLHRLFLGTDNAARIRQGIYNRWYGSLIHLLTLTRLQELDINATDISSASNEEFEANIGKVEDIRTLIFDLLYSRYYGVIVYVRIFRGELVKGQKIKFSRSQKIYQVERLGVKTPQEVLKEKLGTGEIG
ncbi:4751_t:CDS:2 [Racocetra fulgida]|uniref:4751_t:CDS:1 n=1 Tax=Racocetra fulgida TaxID=60492 RepID=A0A9N9AYM7_9GLOM|nr:4751_t:CDS:2 [Racocetra fulgida]